MTAAEKGDDRVSDKHASQHGDIYHNGSTGFGGNADIAEMNCIGDLFECLNLETTSWARIDALRTNPSLARR